MTDHKILETLRPAELTEEEWDLALSEEKHFRREEGRAQERIISSRRLGNFIPSGVTKPK